MKINGSKLRKQATQNLSKCGLEYGWSEKYFRYLSLGFDVDQKDESGKSKKYVFNDFERFKRIHGTRICFVFLVYCFVIFVIKRLSILLLIKKKLSKLKTFFNIYKMFLSKILIDAGAGVIQMRVNLI